MSQQQNSIIYTTEDGKVKLSLYARDGSVWINQNQLAELFNTSKQNIGQHIANILEEKELEGDSVVKNYFTTAGDGKDYNVTFYSLEMILAIGFRVRSKRGTQFRQWANRNLREYMVKGFVMDDDRLKTPMDALIISMSCWRVSAIFMLLKNDFTKKYAICLSSAMITTPPTRLRRCFLLRRKTKYSLP